MIKIQERWRNLKFSNEKMVMQLLDSSHPLKFYIGKDERDNPILFLEEIPHFPDQVQFKTIEIGKIQRSNIQYALKIRLLNKDLLEMFCMLCNDIVDHSRKSANTELGLEIVFRRLNSWRKLLEEKKDLVLSENEIRGLVGELYFLEKNLAPEITLREAIKSWSGPSKKDQDFSHIDSSWEIKTIHPDAKAVQIASENQLQTFRTHLFLVIFVLQETTLIDQNRISLNDLVQRVRNPIAQFSNDLEVFDNKLLEVGYIYHACYDDYQFKVLKETHYKVIEGFPRLTSTSLPSGIFKTKYSIRFDSLKPFEILK